MIIKKTIQVTIIKEEKEVLKKAEKILEEVCNTFDSDCEECPLYNLCGSDVCKPAPHTMLYKYISVLPVED